MNDEAPGGGESKEFLLGQASLRAERRVKSRDKSYL